MKSQYYFLLGFTVLLSACFQFNSLQTGRTLPKGSSTLGAAAAINITPPNEYTQIIPQAEVFARRGLTQNFDVGLKLSSWGSLGFDGKYQVLGDQTSNQAIAVGAAFEFWYDFFKYVASYQTAALYYSFHPNENFAWYVTPKLIHSFESSVSGGEFLNYSQGFSIAGNIGFQKRIRPRVSLLAEMSGLFSFENDFFVFRPNIGFRFDLK